MEKLKKRSEIAPQDTWDLEALYATDEVWEADRKKAEELLDAFQKLEGTLGQSPAHLKEALDQYFALMRVVENVYVYAQHRRDQDTADAYYQKMAMQAEDLLVKTEGSIAFVNPEILSLSEEWVDQALEQEKGLGFYRRILKEIFRMKSHTRNGEAEGILARASDLGNAPSSIFHMFDDADLKYPSIKDENGEEVPLTDSSLVPLMESSDRRVRREAFQAYYKVREQFKNTSAAIFSANVKQALFFTRERSYPSSRARYLDQSNIPEAVYDSLIETVHQNMDKMYRYVAIRKKMLGVDELHMYDVYAPLLPESTASYTFEEAKKIVAEGLKPMGQEYLDILKEGFENRWIDVYENEGKRSGAYSGGSYDSHPYVLLNYRGTLDNVFTLAHEMGHSVHSYYSRKNQPYAYSDYKIFVAEVASTCNEALLIHDLLKKTSDKAMKMTLINHFLDKFKGTIYRQTMFAEFEYLMHQKAQKGKPLTAQEISSTYLELNQLYFGPDMVSDQEIALEWSRIPHFYTPFYVYQYATGFSAAIALSNKILDEGAPAVERYKTFLKGGSSMDPIDLLKTAGVDMTTSQPVQAALDVFGSLVDQMEEMIQ